MTERIIGIDRLENLINVFGAFDENLHLLEKELQVSIIDRESELHISGDEENTAYAEQAIEGLMKLAARGEPINAQNVRYVLKLAREGRMDQLSRIQDDVVCVTAKGRPIKAKTLGQRTYIDAIRKNTVTLAVGPAGTGKTYLAVACAVTAYRAKECSRIILTRPAVEAGEKLGFLPGDLQNKVDPYLRPLYDALFDMLGPETYQQLVEKGNIEVAPLAYMRGRTLDDSFIILDEAQNTSREQMKMFLTRIGFGSKVVITGDITQIDLPEDKVSGLKVAMTVLEGIDDSAICTLTGADVVRHRLVQKIIEAYEVYDKKNPPETAKKPGPQQRGRYRKL
jgi:phosphate starvation-inducible PhoH-like protein